MAKVTITIEDVGDDKVTTNFDFDPPIRKDTPSTAALRVAMNVLEAVKALAAKGTAAQMRVPGEEEE